MPKKDGSKDSPATVADMVKQGVPMDKARIKIGRQQDAAKAQPPK